MIKLRLAQATLDERLSVDDPPGISADFAAICRRVSKHSILVLPSVFPIGCFHMTSRPPCWGTRKIRNINWFGHVWYCTACLNVSTFLITRASARWSVWTHALERQDGTAEVGAGACNCVVCGRAGRKCPAHRRMSIVAGAGGSGWQSRG